MSTIQFPKAEAHRPAEPVYIVGHADAIWQRLKEKRRLAPGAISGLSTGFLKLDDLLDGLCPQTLTLFGARPKHGKTDE